ERADGNPYSAPGEVVLLAERGGSEVLRRADVEVECAVLFAECDRLDYDVCEAVAADVVGEPGEAHGVRFEGDDAACIADDLRREKRVLPEASADVEERVPLLQN